MVPFFYFSVWLLVAVCSLCQGAAVWARGYPSRHTQAAAMAYDATEDRLYVTGSTRQKEEPRRDCFLGILQIPRRRNNDTFLIKDENVWIRQYDRIGTEESQETCSGIQTFRQGNERKVYLIGHSLQGPSLLASQQNWYHSPEPSNRTPPVVYGFLMDVTWYNGRVPTGYLMAAQPVEYPMAMTALGGDLLVASMQSPYGNINPAYTMLQSSATEEDMMMLGPPEYGEDFGLHVQRLGQRTFSMNDLLTLPTNDTTTSYVGYKAPSFRQFQTAVHPTNNRSNSSVETSGNASTSTTKHGANAVLINATDGVNNVSFPMNATLSNHTTVPPSYDQYRYVVEPLVERWGRTFSAQEKDDPILSSVQVSSMLLVTVTTTTVREATDNDDDATVTRTMFDDDIVTVERTQPVLLVAGSTRGSSRTLGGHQRSFNVFDADAMHGFVTRLDPSVGVVLGTHAVHAAVVSSHRPTVRILGLCHAAGDTTYDNHAVYIAGMTDGIILQGQSTVPETTPQMGVYQAFLQKIHVATFDVLWTKQLPAAKFSSLDAVRPGSVQGMACAVTPDGRQVYLGGMVRDGAALTLDGGVTNATASGGGDDLFLAQFATEDGSLNYVRQMGSPWDDALASGVSLVSDKYGNAILLANTRSPTRDLEEEPMDDDDNYDDDDDSEDRNGIQNSYNNQVLIFSVDRRSGEHVDLSGMYAAAAAKPTAQPDEDGDTIEPAPSPPGIDKKSSADMEFVYIWIPVMLTALFIFCFFWWLLTRRRRSEERIIARYLRSLEVIQKNRGLDPPADVEQVKLCPNEEDRTECNGSDLLDGSIHFGPPFHTLHSLNDDAETATSGGSSSRCSDSLRLHSDEQLPLHETSDTDRSSPSSNRRARRMMKHFKKSNRADPWFRW